MGRPTFSVPSTVLRLVKDWGCVVGLLVPLLGALAWILPKAPRQPFFETLVWSVVLLVAFGGWGSLLAFLVARNERIDVGLRMAWGASVVVFVGGVLMVPSAMTRTAALLLADLGVLLAILALVRERRALRRSVYVAVRLGIGQPRLVLLGGVVCAILAVHYAAGIAEWHTNPYDDDIAYLTFARKLLDTGSFPEPFSFRRLAALGGQTLFLALTMLRATAERANTFDRSMSIALLAALIVGHRVAARRPSLVFVVPTLLLVPLLPVVAINTAPHFSAIAFFVALFRTSTWASEQPRSPLRSAVPVALVAATLCTLRQNYLPVPAVFLSTLWLGRLLSTLRSAPASRWAALRAALAEPLLVTMLSVVAIAPWMVAAWQSNHTFLYPVMLGTFNRALELKSTSTGIVHEFRLYAGTLLDGIPLPTLGLFVIGGLLLRERRPNSTVVAFFIAAAAGLGALVHALSQGDAGNLGRYACGFMVAFAVVTGLTAGFVRWRSPFDRSHFGAAIVLVALLLQLGRSVESATKFYNRSFRNLEIVTRVPVRPDGAKRARQDFYGHLQYSVPAGERIAVLLDEPHWLDFSRNPIWNLDMPGYSSLPPGLPFFEGSERVAAYLKQIGIRYLAFVRPESSSYHYRREYWLALIVDEMEVWRAFAPYIIDMLDNLVALAERHKRLYDAEGMIVLDLETSP